MAPKVAPRRRAYTGNLQSVTRRPRWLTRFVNGVAAQQVHKRNGNSRLGIANVKAIEEFLIARGPEETGQILQLLLFWRPGIFTQVSRRIDVKYTEIRTNVRKRLRSKRSIVLTADGVVMS